MGWKVGDGSPDLKGGYLCAPVVSSVQVSRGEETGLSFLGILGLPAGPWQILGLPAGPQWIPGLPAVPWQILGLPAGPWRILELPASL